MWCGVDYKSRTAIIIIQASLISGDISMGYALSPLTDQVRTVIIHRICRVSGHVRLSCARYGGCRGGVVVV